MIEIVVGLIIGLLFGKLVHIGMGAGQGMAVLTGVLVLIDCLTSATKSARSKPMTELLVRIVFCAAVFRLEKWSGTPLTLALPPVMIWSIYRSLSDSRVSLRSKVRT